MVLWESWDCPQFNEDGEVFKEADGICGLPLADESLFANLSSPIVCHGYGSVISIQKYAFLESQDERCLVNLERNVEITLKEHRKKMQDEGYRKDFSI